MTHLNDTILHNPCADLADSPAQTCRAGNEGLRASTSKGAELGRKVEITHLRTRTSQRGRIPSQRRSSPAKPSNGQARLEHEDSRAFAERYGKGAGVFMFARTDVAACYRRPTTHATPESAQAPRSEQAFLRECVAKRSPVNRAKPMLFDSLDMRRACVSFVRREIVLRVLPSILAHKRITFDLRHNGGGGDGSALPIALHHESGTFLWKSFLWVLWWKDGEEEQKKRVALHKFRQRKGRILQSKAG